MSDTIAVDSVTGPGFVTILPTDLAFEVIGDCSWSLINDLEAPRLVNAEQIMADAGCTNPTPDLEQFGLGTLWDTDWTCTVDGVDVVFTTYADVDQLDLATEAYLEPVVRHVYGLSIVYGLYA